MALPCVWMGAVRLRSGALYRFLCRSSSHQATPAAEEIDIPRKKTWNKTAVLQALSYTVNHDPTSASYIFRDDAFLLPKSAIDHNVYSMSCESGRIAAKYVLNMYPKLFEGDPAEPHIPFLMPENVQPQIEGISEEALMDNIKLRRSKVSVDLYDQLLQAGTPPSLETANRLLDLLCFYGDREPTPESREDLDEQNENENDQEIKNIWIVPEVKKWRANSNAERIFNLLPEKDAHSFRTMIRGMVKHGAYSKAFNVYADLLNNRLTGDVHTFNALITAVPGVKGDRRDIWTPIVDLLNQMIYQKVQPNLQTFHAILSSLRKSNQNEMAVQAFNEMKALKIEPSLGTYSYLLWVFYKASNPMAQAGVLKEILQMIQGKSFTPQDPEDVKFFVKAMKVCLDSNDLAMAYRVDALKNTGDNWKLLGNRNLQDLYYTYFFHLLCLTENLDGVLKWYRENIPSRHCAKAIGIQGLLQVIEVENRFELIPQIWKDMYLMGHTSKTLLIQRFLQTMAREKQNPELQDEFANIATSMKAIYDEVGRPSSKMIMSGTVLGDIIILLSRAGRMKETWQMLKLFKSQNLVPRSVVIEELLEAARGSDNTSAAMDLVQLAIRYSLPNTTQLAKTVLDNFTLSEEQRETLQDLTQSSSSDSSDSSDSDEE